MELIRLQKEQLPKAAGAEELSCGDMLKAERNRNGTIGKYFNALSHTLPYRQVKKSQHSKAIFGTCKQDKKGYSIDSNKSETHLR